MGILLLVPSAALSQTPAPPSHVVSTIVNADVVLSGHILHISHVHRARLGGCGEHHTGTDDLLESVIRLDTLLLGSVPDTLISTVSHYITNADTALAPGAHVVFWGYRNCRDANALWGAIRNVGSDGTFSTHTNPLVGPPGRLSLAAIGALIHSTAAMPPAHAFHNITSIGLFVVQSVRPSARGYEVDCRNVGWRLDPLPLAPTTFTYTSAAPCRPIILPGDTLAIPLRATAATAIQGVLAV